MIILCRLLLAYQIVILGRVLLSWFPLQPGGFMAKVNHVLIRLTEPLLGPLRRILPRAGHARPLAARGHPADLGAQQRRLLTC